MSENVLIAFITFCSAIGGGIITGIFMTRAAKLTADREDRRRREERDREKADERINNLYEPLLTILTPGPPYDEFYIDHDTWIRIRNLIDENERIASPDLLNIFWKIRRGIHEQPGDIDRELEWGIYEQTSLEYEKLKDIVGYGNILEKESKIKLYYQKIKSSVDDKLSEYRRKIRYSKIRKRRRKINEE